MRITAAGPDGRGTDAAAGRITMSLPHGARGKQVGGGVLCSSAALRVNEHLVAVRTCGRIRVSLFPHAH